MASLLWSVIHMCTVEHETFEQQKFNDLMKNGKLNLYETYEGRKLNVGAKFSVIVLDGGHLKTAQC